MTRVSDEYRVERLQVLPRSESSLGPGAHDPRSEYAERFWLPVLGPSAFLLLRRLAMGLEHWPDGFECSTRDLSLSLGLGPHGGRGSLGRVIRRTAEFGLTTMQDEGRLLVGSLLPSLPPRMVHRLPAWLQSEHRVDRLREPASASVGRAGAQRATKYLA